MTVQVFSREAAHPSPRLRSLTIAPPIALEGYLGELPLLDGRALLPARTPIGEDARSISERGTMDRSEDVTHVLEKIMNMWTRSRSIDG
jgi:hypothetical protein